MEMFDENIHIPASSVKAYLPRGYIMVDTSTPSGAYGYSFGIYKAKKTIFKDKDGIIDSTIHAEGKEILSSFDVRVDTKTWRQRSVFLYSDIENLPPREIEEEEVVQKIDINE